MGRASWVTERQPARRKLTAAQLARRAELKRAKYRNDPAHRLAEINRARRNGGYTELAALPQENNHG